MGTRFRFDGFELDPIGGELWKEGRRVKLQDLPMRLLVLLVERSGEVVTREEVRQRLWPEGTYVDFDSGLAVAVRKVREALRDDSSEPRFIETIPKRGYRFLAKVEQLSTFPSEPERIPVDPIPEEPIVAPDVTHSRSAWYRVGLASILLLALSAALFSLYRKHQVRARSATSPNTNFQSPVRRSIAVLGFRNLAGHTEEAWLSGAFAEMLSTELSGAANLRIVPGEEIARAKRELPLAEPDTLSKETLSRLRINPGADVVLMGSYTVLTTNGKKRVRLDLRLQDTSSGETIAEKAVTGAEDNLFELASDAGAELRNSLGAFPLSTETSAATRAALPANETAIKYFSQGRQALWGLEYVKAKDLLSKAVQADPNFALSHVALADAWSHLGFNAKSEMEAKRAVELSSHLSREDQLQIEGQYRYSIRDWRKAIDAYQTLFRLYPDNLEYGLLLAGAQIPQQPSDAVATLEQLKKLPPPNSEDPRIDLKEASAFIPLDLRNSREAAERAIAKATARGSNLSAAQGYGILCQASVASGENSIQECEKARDTYRDSGDIDNAARALNDLAGIYFQQGDLQKAETMWAEAGKVFSQIGSMDGYAPTLNNIGDVRLARGDLQSARIYLNEALRGYLEVEDKDGIALVHIDLGNVDWLQGKLSSAEQRYSNAKAIASSIRDYSALAYAAIGMGEVQLDREDFANARKHFEESLALREKTGSKLAIAESKVALARLALEEGKAAAAAADLAACIEQFRRENQSDDELLARSARIEALLAQGRLQEAQQEEEIAAVVAARNQNQLARFRFDLASSRTLAASGHPEKAEVRLKSLIQAADKLGFTGIELESRLGLLLLQAGPHPDSEVRKTLLTLRQQAEEKQFFLIARKAAVP
ncbi:MAG TPA: tetratricopeptide repeat protein [Terriglobia bacterium]|nr:tetratricopeptide repeat protein [Terriglobia bacterium]